MKSKKLNKAIVALEELALDGIHIPYMGWYWRDVDWNRDWVSLAVAPSSTPSWFAMTLEARIGKPWSGRAVAFCENNKWGYDQFRVEGKPWKKLRALVTGLVKTPTVEAMAELLKFMESIAPADSEVTVP